jgi:transposase
LLIDKEVKSIMSYSMDYRRVVAAAYDECESSAEVAEQFGCSESWVRRLIQRRREGGTLEPFQRKSPDQRAYDDADEQKIRELIREQPDATLAEVAALLAKPVHLCTVSRTLGRLGLPRKKSPRMPPSKIDRT